MAKNTTKEMAKLRAQIEKHKEDLAKLRDLLRRDLDELQDIMGSVEEGYQALEAAVDTLSQYV